MITRKHYRSVANQIAALHDNAASGREADGIAKVAQSLAYLYAIDNPRFSETQFYAACGLNSRGGSPRWGEIDG